MTESPNRRRRTPTNHPTIARLEEQAREGRKKLVAEGHLVSKAELAARLGVEPFELDEAVRDERLFYLDVGSPGAAERYFPAFYAHPAMHRSDLERVCKAMADLKGGSKWQFFVNPRGSLSGLSPLEALQEGRVEEVERAALAFTET